MNSEVFDTLQAGSEADALIAKYVMGWHLINEDVMPWCDVNGDPVDGGPEWVDAQGKHGAWGWNWHPSTFIAHAWDVVERVRNLYGPGEGGPDFWIEARERDYKITIDTSKGFKNIFDESASLGICRAVLLHIHTEKEWEQECDDQASSRVSTDNY